MALVERRQAGMALVERKQAGLAVVERKQAGMAVVERKQVAEGTQAELVEGKLAGMAVADRKLEELVGTHIVELEHAPLVVASEQFVALVLANGQHVAPAVAVERIVVGQVASSLFVERIVPAMVLAMTASLAAGSYCLANATHQLIQRRRRPEQPRNISAKN